MVQLLWYSMLKVVLWEFSYEEKSVVSVRILKGEIKKKKKKYLLSFSKLYSRTTFLLGYQFPKWYLDTLKFEETVQQLASMIFPYRTIWGAI